MTSWKGRGLWGALTASLVLIGVVAMADLAEATPIYAVRAANACDTCHIEPMGWANPEDAARFCTMDCNGCHVSSTGGGLRTPSGEYYGKQVLPMWGTRPSEFGNPRDYLPEGYPDKGRYRLSEGFSGWWAGSTNMRDIPKRFGDIDPDPKFSWGMDYRGALYAPLGKDEKIVGFPMQADIYLSGRPLPNLVLYSNAGLKGSKNRGAGGDGSFTDELDDLLAFRELFIKVDRLPNNSYVRAGRFAPPYGWRLPDHTSFIRRDLGFDENRQVFGLEGGYNPNYLFSNAAIFYQGLEAWPGDTGDEGIGGAATGGWRDLGWQAFGSFHYLDRTLDEAFDELSVGAGWGLNLFPAVYLGEVDYRRQFGDGGDIDAIFAYHEINYLVTRGLSAMLKYDYQDPNLDILDDHRDRYTLGVQFEPYTYLQAMLQYRLNFQAKEFVNQEILFILHAWL